MNVDQFIHLLQTVICRCHNVVALQWDILVVPVSPAAHPGRVGYHQNAHYTVTPKHIYLQDDHEHKGQKVYLDDVFQIVRS